MSKEIFEREIFLDILKILATFAVIFLHVCAFDFYSISSYNWYISACGDSLVRWCVPMFVMISGALFLNPDKEITYKGIFTKYIPRLLFAYVFWSVAYCLCFKFRYGFPVRNLLNSHFHLWFLPMLMGLYLLVPILRRISSDEKLTRYALLIWIIYLFFNFFQFSNLFKDASHFYNLFNMNSIVGYSGYFLLGYYLFKHDFSKRQKMWIYLCGILGILITICGTVYLSIIRGKPTSFFFGYLTVHTAAAATALFVLIKTVAPKCGKIMQYFLKYVRKDLFGIYLIHIFFLSVINPRTIHLNFCCSYIITLPLISIAIFILSLYSIKLIRLVPFLRKIVE